MDGVGSTANTTSMYQSGFKVGGLISGLDTDAIIKQLMDVAKQPIKELESDKSDYQAQLTAWKQFNGVIVSLLSKTNLMSRESSFASKTVSLSEEDYMSATATPDADMGIYSLRVVQLAKTNQLASDAYGDKDYTTYGTGTLSITVGTDNPDTKTIDIGEDNQTLEGIATSINNSGAGVTATVIDTGDPTTPYKLIITSKTSGSDGSISFTNNLSGGTGTLNLSTLQAAQDSKIYLGDEDSHIELTRSSNTVTDVIPGVTMNLTKISSEYFEMRVSTDTEASTNLVNGFIDSYNTAVDFFTNQFWYDATTGKQGTLAGDSTLMTTQNQMEKILFGPSANTGVYSYLTQIGVNADSTGKLAITEMSKFNEAVQQKPESIYQLFNNETGGISVKLGTYLDDLLATPAGAVSSAQDFTQEQIDALDETIKYKNEYLILVEDRYRTQFLDMEAALGLMRNQMSTLTASLSSLANAVTI